jgi:uncharacterized protein YkwD
MRLLSAAFARALSLLHLLRFIAAIFACLVVCCAAHGQAVDTPPVAKLINAGPVTTRPRRVNPSASEESQVSVVAVALNFEDASPIEKKAFEETNSTRVKNGLPPLTWDPDLYRMARTNSERMSRLGYFSHVTPEGKRLRERARDVGITHYRVLGENIAYNSGYDDPAAFAVERWMLSSGHRANILNAEFKAMAVGSFVAADGSVFITQTFITR